MKSLREALISKNNRDWASKGEEWCLIFPFSGDQSRLEIKPNAVKILVAGWVYILLKPNQIGYDLYKEIISNYRKQVNSLDTQKIEEYLQYFVNGDKIFEIIQDEVF